MDQLAVFLVVAGIILLAVRLLGAWMLRINDVISESKETNRLLRILISENRETRKESNVLK